ncbi:rhodanese-related sulfurtransferase [Saprospira grandis]|nr:rhodanese-related sulfurtransferase [Saprospira grandis]
MYQTLLYYKYAHLEDAEEMAPKHLEFCKDLGILGRIIIANEGLNGTISGTPEQCQAYMDYVESDPRLKGIHWKIDEVEELSFVKMHVRYKAEIVNSGLYDSVDPTKETGKHLQPAEFKALKDQEDVVVIDMRSNYEHKLGRFKGAITMDIDNFREFPEKIKEMDHLKDKKVLTYCTGGIKCEKASAYLIQQGFQDVYQLHGGIINYGKEVGGEDFEGDCYVFDGRVHVPVNTVNPSVISRCYNCGKKTTRMVNCCNSHCNDHIVQCESCSQEMAGACSVQCKASDFARPYNEKGFYRKQLCED